MVRLGVKESIKCNYNVYTIPRDAEKFMNKYLTPEQGFTLEYLDDNFWFLLTEYNPIRLLYKYKIRIKREELL